MSRSDSTTRADRPGYIRHVSGWGPRCGCGGKSALHVGLGNPGDMRRGTSTFLCADCMVKAIALFVQSRPEQPPYWPGDEGRDEHYVDPRDVAR
jgi:hypothetical protein